MLAGCGEVTLGLSLHAGYVKRADGQQEAPQVTWLLVQDREMGASD